MKSFSILSGILLLGFPIALIFKFINGIYWGFQYGLIKESPYLLDWFLLLFVLISVTVGQISLIRNRIRNK